MRAGSAQSPTTYISGTRRFISAARARFSLNASSATSSTPNRVHRRRSPQVVVLLQLLLTEVDFVGLRRAHLYRTEIEIG